MSAKFFLDTNIFVYSFDTSEPQKQKKAQALAVQELQSAKTPPNYFSRIT